MPTSASTSTLRRSERKTDRQDTVVEALRERIVQGDLLPGSRLPTRLEIEQSFGASSITVQRALERLKNEGFVVASRRSGTHVVENPPHLTHFALVFPGEPGDQIWNRFWTALCNETSKLEASGERKIPIYYGVDGHEDSEDYQNLTMAMRANRFAGVIFGNNTSSIRNSPIVNEPGIARVAIMMGPVVNNIPQVFPDMASLMTKGLDSLVAGGRKKVAIIKPTGFQEDLLPEIAKRGLTTRPYWIHDISLWNPETARSVVHLLMQSGQNERPDAIFVIDDNLLTAVVDGLLDAGVKVPEDVELITHCNFPWPVPSALPVQRVGYDVKQVLQVCLDRIDEQRRGEAVQLVTRIPACLEAELTAR